MDFIEKVVEWLKNHFTKRTTEKKVAKVKKNTNKIVSLFSSLVDQLESQPLELEAIKEKSFLTVAELQALIDIELEAQKNIDSEITKISTIRDNVKKLLNEKI